MKVNRTMGIANKNDKGNNFSFWRACSVFTLILLFGHAQAGDLKLQTVDFTTLPGDDLQLQLQLSGPAAAPKVFHTDNPARIALDLPGVGNALEKKTVAVNVGGAESVQAIEASGRTRVIINLTAMVPYSSRVEGNSIFVTLRKGHSGPFAGARQEVVSEPAPTPRTKSNRPVVAPDPNRSPQIAYSDANPMASGKRIENIDFRRGEHGEGRVLVTLSDARTVADIREEGRKVVVDLPGVALPQSLASRLDVLDFATPVQTIESSQDGRRSKLVISPVSPDYDYSSYQTDKVLTVEFRPLTKAEKEELKKKAFAYTGEKLTLNFQDIPVRQVLSILADFTGKNIVASDTVQGNVTLSLKDTPWDQALDLVLKSKGLGKREEGNIIRVAPLDDINKQEKEELEAQKVVEDLEPLRTEIIQINYTKAEDLKKVLSGTTEKTVESESSSSNVGTPSSSSTTTSNLDVSQSILSGRGNVTVDARTNQLIVKDTPRNLERIRDLVRMLDIPVRQVLIESRIVIANNDFSRELGSRLSLNQKDPRGKKFSQYDVDPLTGKLVKNEFQEVSSGGVMTSPDLLVDLAKSGFAGPGGAAGFTLMKAGDYLLDLELSAAQKEGRGEVVSNPRLVTSDQTKAVIKQGVEIPYQSTVVAGGGGVATISFKQAVLELNVTPHITPDDNILMELLIRKDSPGAQFGANFGIDKREIETTAQVSNGETVVLGGVYEGTKSNTTDKVPFLGDLPGIGFMFRRNQVEDKKKELLIFITPKILKQQIVAK